MINKSFPLWGIVIVLFIAAFLIRSIYIANLAVDDPIRGDAFSYTQYASNILEYGTFSKERSINPTPDAYWAPGYPVFLAITIKISELLQINAYNSILYLQAIMGALLVVLTYLVGSLFLPPGYSLAAAILIMLSPHQISLGGYVLTETLFALLLLFSLLCLFYAQKQKVIMWSLLGGLSFGLCYLVNPVIMFTPLFLMAYRLFHSKSEPIRLQKWKRQASCMLGMFLLVFLCWQARTALVVPESSPSSSERLFVNIVVGAHSDFHSNWRINHKDPDNPGTVDIDTFQGSYSQFFSAMLTRISERPVHYLEWYFITKPIMLWDWNILTGQGDIFVFPVFTSMYHTKKPAIASHIIMKNLHFYLFAAALLGMAFLYLKRNEANNNVAVQLYIVLISVSAVYVLSQSEARYSVPLRAELYLCAVYMLHSLTEYLKKLKKGFAPLPQANQ